MLRKREKVDMMRWSVSARREFVAKIGLEEACAVWMEEWVLPQEAGMS